MRNVAQSAKPATATIDRSEFDVPGMDCPSEEQTIRLSLDGIPSVRRLEFDLPERKLKVWHDSGTVDEVNGRLATLGFGAVLRDTRSDLPWVAALPSQSADAAEARTLWAILAINLVMFVAELTVGIAAQSTGLIADSLDMLADSMVYGLSLYAVGRLAVHKLRAARASGYLQLALAIGVLVEVGRRMVLGSEPGPQWMMGVAAIALIANTACLLLIARHRHGGAHMRASYIFSTNDVLANVGVIGAGLLVSWTGSNLPDLVMGVLIGLLLLSGAVRILRIPGP